MRIRLITCLFVLFQGCQSNNPSEKQEPTLTGEWKIIDFDLKIATPLSEKEMALFQDEVNRQKRRFIHLSSLKFNEDMTYQWNFTGKKEDVGTWKTIKNQQLIYQSNDYNVPDTITIDYFSPDTCRLQMKQADQTALITIARLVP